MLPTSDVARVVAIAVATSGCASFMGLDQIEASSPPTFADVVMDSASELVVDGADLFWTTPTSVRTCVLGACEPTTLVSDVSVPHALEVAIADVRYATADVAYRVPRAGGAAPQVLIDRMMNSQPITDFVRSGPHLFYTHERLARCNYNDTSRCTSDTTIADVIGRAVTVDPAGRVWGTGVNTGVRVMDAGNTQVALTLPTDTVPRALLATPGSVFVLQTSDDILEWPATATSSVVGAIALQASSPSAIADDGLNVWVATTRGELWRRPLLGGPDDAVLVATATAPIVAIAVTDEAVIVALPDRIASFSVAP